MQTGVWGQGAITLFDLTMKIKTAAFAATALASSLAVSGCGLSTLTSGLSGSMFGSKSEPSTVQSVTEEQLLSAAKAEYGEGGVNVGQIAHGCPRFELAQSNHAFTVYEPGGEGDALAVMHRGEITRTARECTISNGQVAVKYGFSGRVLLGPRGRAGLVSLPVQVSVTGTDRTQLQAEELRVDVNVSVDKPIGYFSIVRTVTFAVPQGSRPGEYDVLVGFKPTKPNLGSGLAPQRS